MMEIQVTGMTSTIYGISNTKYLCTESLENVSLKGHLVLKVIHVTVSCFYLLKISILGEQVFPK